MAVLGKTVTAAKAMIERLDHLVLTVANISKSVEFYTRVLGMEEVTFAGGRKALSFGQQKINLHEVGKSLVPAAVHPTAGAGDLCFITRLPLADFISHLAVCGVPIELGPVPRTGALGPIQSVYFRDPDGNLLEVSVYAER